MTCEEIVTEEDLIEIRGIHWREQEEPHTGVLEEFEYPHMLTFMDLTFESSDRDCDLPDALNLENVEYKSLAVDIQTHLQSVGKFIRVQDIVEYLTNTDVWDHHGSTKHISLSTAQCWMQALGYCWKKEPKGQYSDGYEYDDVIAYQQQTFLPSWEKYQPQMWCWKQDNPLLKDPTSTCPGCHVIMWFHNESTFYTNDQQQLQWVHKSESATPKPKGEGASLMVADFISADYGWLQSPDKKESAHVIFKAGKQCNRYYTNGNIIEHAEKAMDILRKHYPDDDHVLVFNNTSIHLKHADNALSARSLPKNPLATFGITVTEKDGHGRVIYGADGKPNKTKIPMTDGHPQSLYFPAGHEKADKAKLQAECKNFKCPPEAGGKCCCHCFLYNQPDFTNVESCLEVTCQEQGFPVLFLPKFHCKLNFIKQCWGCAKCLTGQQAAWAMKKYHGHRALPESILLEFDKAYPSPMTPDTQ
ncbi:hypothetical protein BS17DRAFT_795740 [Gyrodon lividus]|nr:hypothetical protein BS17DRAFT_795740 [Gyrodon lividus]